MSKPVRLKQSILLPMLLCLLAMVGCSSEPVLPTRAIAAAPIQMPSEVLTMSERTEFNRNIDRNLAHDRLSAPPTWTPAPAQTPVHAAVSDRPLSATLSPTATPPFPTKTATPTPTATATATATRYVSPIRDLPPTDELGPSKMGLHVVRNNDPAIMDFVRRAQPAVVKAVDDLGFLKEVKEASPRTITVGRISIPSQDYEGSPEEAARRFVAENLEKYRLNPAVDYWEGWNEPDPNYDHMIWYSRFEQERVRQMALHGFRCAIGGFATGVPELDEFQLFLPAIDMAMKHGGVLTLHEYSAPDMTYGYGAPLPGYSGHSDRGALTFRYRWFYREILEPGGMVIPLIITEAGIDGIIGNRPGPQGLGWADFEGYWVQQGLGESGEQAFINQLAWYDAGVRQDGYVIGFTVFTAGGIGQWKRYDINPILPRMADYSVSQR